MSIHTEIQWCDDTANSVMGCAGCELRNGKINACYAGHLHDMKVEWIAERVEQGKRVGYARGFEDVTRFPGRIAEAARWAGLRGQSREDKPWLTSAPRMIFHSDMGDALAVHRSAYVNNKFRSVSPGTDFLYLYTEVIRNVTSADGTRHIWLWPTKQTKRAVEFSQWLRSRKKTWPANLWLGASVT